MSAEVETISVDLTLEAEDPRPDCDGKGCNKEALWSGTPLCGCTLVFCDPHYRARKWDFDRASRMNCTRCWVRDIPCEIEWKRL